MLNEHDRAPVAQIPDQPLDPLALAGAQARERLIEQQRRGAGGQCKPKLEPALFAIGKQADTDVRARGEAEMLEQGGQHQLDFFKAIRRSKDVEPQCAAQAAKRADAHVLPHRELREKLVDLEALGQPMLMGAGHVGCRNIDSVEEDPARIRSFLAIEQPEERALTRAVRADDGVESAGGQLERNSLNGMDATIGLADIAYLERQLEGSYPETESRLSDIALSWMARQATKQGLKTGPIFVNGDKIPGTNDAGEALHLSPSADGVQHCEIAGMRDTINGYAEKAPKWKWLQSYIRDQNWPGKVREITPEAPVDPSVEARFALPSVVQCAGFGPYRPPALKDHLKFKSMYTGAEPAAGRGAHDAVAPPGEN